MLTKEQGVAMLGFALLIMVVLFGTLHFSRERVTVCIEHNSQASSRQIVEGVEQQSFTEDKERRCS